MRNICLKLWVVGVIFLSYLPAARAQEIAIGPVVSTTGVGIEAATPIIARSLNLNAGVTGFGFNFTVHINGGDLASNYHAKVRLGAVPVFLTYYPFGGVFNLQAGVLFNNNRISVASDTVSADGYTGRITGSSHFNLAAPFFAIGFGQPFAGGRFTFTGNLGLAYAGGPAIRLQPSIPLEQLSPQVNSQIQADTHTLNHDAKIAQFFPVLSLGIVYRF